MLLIKGSKNSQYLSSVFMFILRNVGFYMRSTIFIYY